MREPSPRTIYCVRWRDAGIVKVGYSDESRWRIFEPRGAEVVALWQFDTCVEALDHEARCHEILECIGTPAFSSRDDAIASRLLSSRGCGYTECFRISHSVTDSALLAKLTDGLVFR